MNGPKGLSFNLANAGSLFSRPLRVVPDAADLAHLDPLLPQHLEPDRPDLVPLEDDGTPDTSLSAGETLPQRRAENS